MNRQPGGCVLADSSRDTTETARRRFGRQNSHGETRADGAVRQCLTSRTSALACLSCNR